MLQKGKLTGVVKEGYLVEVEMYFGVKRLCRPVFPPGFIAIPYKKWVDKYKDKFLALVDFEEDDKERPLLIGLIPLVKNQTPSEGLEDNMYVLSEKFRVWLDDANNKMIFDLLNNGEILLGDKNVMEHAVLGDKMKKWLEDFSDETKKLADAGKDIATASAIIVVNTIVGPSSVPTNAANFTTYAGQCTAISAAVTALKAQLNTLLSQNVKLK